MSLPNWNKILKHANKHRTQKIAEEGLEISCELLARAFNTNAVVVRGMVLHATAEAILCVPESKLSKKWRHRAISLKAMSYSVPEDFAKFFDRYKGFLQGISRPEKRIRFAMHIVYLYLLR